MPWYDFRCKDCGTVFEKKRSFALASEPASCPACFSRTTQKMLTGANFIGQTATTESVSVPMTRKGGGGCGCGACGCSV